MTSLAERSGFVTAVRDAFDAARIDHVFLHNVSAEELSDSDVDVAVSKDSLRAVEAVARAGALGRLVQQVDYDVPWCRCHTFDTGEGRRRFRQLDVACDPWGISQHGITVARALTKATTVEGSCVPVPRARFAYLLAKRARNGIRDARDEEQLCHAWGADPSGCGAELEEAFGSRGARAAAAMQSGDVDSAVRAIRIALDGAARTPALRARRIGASTVRAARRAVRPTGLVVAVAGPDGTGKSTLAETLGEDTSGVFRRARRLHLTPGILPPPAKLLGRQSGDPSKPQTRPPSGTGGSIARILYLAADTALGWTPRVYVPKTRSALVVLERGWTDLRVDPARYRLGAGHGLVRALDRILPRPDVRFVLSADAGTIHERKPELPVSEIDRQLRAWRKIGGSTELPATSQEETRTRAVETLSGLLSRRVGDLSAFPASLRVLGVPARGGTTYTIARGGGRVRWLLPAEAPGPMGCSLYRPAGVRHRAGAALIGLGHRLDVPGSARIELDTGMGVGPEIGSALGRRLVSLAALLPTDPARSRRIVLSVLDGRRVIAVAKLAPSGDEGLAAELATLLALERVELRTLRPPRVLAWFAWQGQDVLVLSPLPTGGRTDRASGRLETEALVELHACTEALAGALAGEGPVAVHGDFCGWNAARTRGALAAWDWEWAHRGAPLEDWFHWQMQRLVHFGHGSPEQIARMALDPDKRTLRAWTQLGADPTCASASLEQYLETRTASGRDAHNPCAQDIRDRILAALVGPTGRGSA